jgi:hypothetical protein
MDRKFDCLKMKEEIQAKIYAEINDMTYPELRAYLDKRMEKSTLWQRLVKRDKLLKQNAVQTSACI